MTQVYSTEIIVCWNVDRLWELAKDLPVEQRPVEAFKEWLHCVWEREPTLESTVHHIRRIQDADLSKPIILSSSGWIMDGVHRLAKAFLEGHDTVPTVQFVETPEPDFMD